MSVEANKVVVRAFVDAWNRGDLDALARLMADDCRLAVSGQTIPCGPAGMTEIAAHWRQAFPDYHFVLEDLIGEEDRVAARMPFAGTQTGPVLDIPATGRSVRVDEIVIFRIRDGKIVEMWAAYDELGMRRQLGVIP